MIQPATLSVQDASDLVGATAWPLVVLIVALVFRNSLRGVLGREEVELRGPIGLGVSARGRDAAADALVQASVSKEGRPLPKETAESGIEGAARGVEALGRSPKVLWVDDRPSNNRYEVAALTSLGMHVRLSTSTDEALHEITETGPYDVIISDMGRPPDAQAGYTLLDEMRRRGISTPFAIYASSRSAEHFDMAVQRGAVGCTNHPEELISMVSNALRGEAARERSVKGSTRPAYSRLSRGRS